MTASSGVARSAASAKEKQAQDEVAGFLQALTSYPERYARNPKLSFEQHLLCVWKSQQPSRPATAD
jgi:hypothetical protein